MRRIGRIASYFVGIAATSYGLMLALLFVGTRFGTDWMWVAAFLLLTLAAALILDALAAGQ
jgi:hypothetical protein